MKQSTAEILIAARTRSGDSGMAQIEEYFRQVGQRIRSRLVNRCSGDFDVALSDVGIRPAVELQRDDDFKDVGITNLMTFDHLSVTTAVVMQRLLLTRIIGAMLGEDEPEEDPDANERPLSPVEVRIAGRVFDDIVHELQSAWPRRPAPHIALSGPPSSLRNSLIGAERGEVYTATFEVGVDEELYGLLLVAMPTDVVRKLTRKRDGDEQAGDGVSAVDLTSVMKVYVDVVAEMGRVHMSLSDVQGLHRGQLIPLGSTAEVTLRVNGKPMLVGEAGHQDGQRSVRLVRKAE